MALYVRDACGLVTPGDPFVPPKLVGEVADHRGELSAVDRQVGGEEWLSWWRMLLAFEGPQQLGTLDAAGAGWEALDAVAAAHQSLLDWPELDAFNARPALRKAISTSHEDARGWETQRSLEAAALRRPGRVHRAHERIRFVVEALIERLGVSPGRLWAGVIVIAVEGAWSQLVAPGVVLCSEAVVADSGHFSSIVEEAFVSGLDAVEMPLPARQHKPRPLPRSVLPGTRTIWSGPGLELVCERVLAYGDGFEMEIRRSGEPLPGRPSDNFVGLEIELTFADGRHVVVTDLTGPGALNGPGAEGPIVLTPFRRQESGANALWLWAMPLPPEGEVTLGATWPEYGIDKATIAFDGALVRPPQST